MIEKKKTSREKEREKIVRTIRKTRNKKKILKIEKRKIVKNVFAHVTILLIYQIFQHRFRSINQPIAKHLNEKHRRIREG